MNFWQLRVFQEIMLTSSVSQAARNLGRTQSSISATLGKLEEHIGYQLFERRSRRLIPVPEAYFLHVEGEKILQNVDYLDQALAGKRPGIDEEVRIACMPLIAELLIPTVIGKFTATFPSCKFLVSSRHSRAVYRAVSTQKFDIGFAECVEDTDLIHEDRIEVECLCALSANDPLAKKEFIATEDLDAKPCASFLSDHFISERLEQQFRDAGCRFNPQFRFQNAATSCLPLIEEGPTYGVFSPLSIWLNSQTNLKTRNIVYRRMVEPIAFPFAILTPAHRPVSRIARAFLNLLQGEIQMMLGKLERDNQLFRLS